MSEMAAIILIAILFAQILFLVSILRRVRRIETELLLTIEELFGPDDDDPDDAPVRRDISNVVAIGRRVA